MRARRLCIGGSLIGSIKETQEMLDLCGEKNITCDVEVRRRHEANLDFVFCYDKCKVGCFDVHVAGQSQLELSAMQVVRHVCKVFKHVLFSQ